MRGEFVWDIAHSGLRTLSFLALLGLASCDGPRQPEPVRFEAVQPELFGLGGALTDAWADFDLDGDPDRFVGFREGAGRLYENRGESGFVDVAAAVGLVFEGSVRTSAWGDYDADGDPDLFLGFAGGEPVTALFRNDGGRFTEAAAETGLAVTEGTTRQAAWIDYDRDGDLDLFLALRDRDNLLFRNEGPDGFLDVSAASGIGDSRRTVGALWFDADMDGDLDLVTANMNGDGNGLWRNDAGRFTDIAGGTPVESGGRVLGDEAQGSVRVCAPDVEPDGLFDLFFANYGPSALLRATAPGTWASPEPGDSLGTPSRYDTCVWGDFDNDGALDLYLNGTVGGDVHYRDHLYRRESGHSFFSDVTPPELLELKASHGATWVDFDGDGDLDLALAGAAPDGMHHLMMNRLQAGYRWQSLAVRVLDGSGHATRPGAEVRLFDTGSGRLLGAGIVDTGSGYDAQSDLPLHFGIPGGRAVDVEITVIGAAGRQTGRVPEVDPAVVQNQPLVVWVDDQGSARVVSPVGVTGPGNPR